MQIITIKRGDTFQFYATITDDDENPLIDAAENLKCQIRDSLENLISDLDITATATLGEYLFKASSTDLWPITTIYADIQITNNGVIISSETLAISVEKDVTKSE